TRAGASTRYSGRYRTGARISRWTGCVRPSYGRRSETIRSETPRRSRAASSWATKVSETRGYPLTTTTRAGLDTLLSSGPLGIPRGSDDGPAGLLPFRAPARHLGVDEPEPVQETRDPVAGGQRLARELDHGVGDRLGRQALGVEHLDEPEGVRRLGPQELLRPGRDAGHHRAAPGQPE